MVHFLDYWVNAMVYLVIPLLTVAIFFFVKRKLLWAAPLISTALSFITYMMVLGLSGMKSPILKIFGNSEWRAFFLLAMLIQLVIVVVLTVIAYFIAYILKRKKK